MESEFLFVQSILNTPELPALGPARRSGVLTETELGQKIGNVSEWLGRREAQVRALIWIWHDHLDAAHSLAQEMDGADGAYLHGIIHRREPDYSNARYWFNRVGNHGSFGVLQAEVADFLASRSVEGFAERLAPSGQWDPFAFIDACAAALRVPDSDPQQIIRSIQGIELRNLLNYFLKER